MKRVICVALAGAFLGGCATDAEVRDTCANHGGVRAVSGNAMRRYVSCIDGYFRTVR
jgi:hypothetical protein